MTVFSSVNVNYFPFSLVRNKLINLSGFEWGGGSRRMVFFVEYFEIDAHFLDHNGVDVVEGGR